MRYADRSVICTARATSATVASGCRATVSSTCAWLVMNVQERNPMGSIGPVLSIRRSSTFVLLEFVIVATHVKPLVRRLVLSIPSTDASDTCVRTVSCVKLEVSDGEGMADTKVGKTRRCGPRSVRRRHLLVPALE